MSERETDDLLLERAVAELRRLPDVPSGAAARVSGAAMAAARGDRAAIMPSPVRGGWRRAAAYVGLAVAAAVVGYVARGALQPTPHAVPPVAARATTLVPVADGGEADTRPLPRQFVFRSRTARRVSLVGDFNDWNPRATPLERSAGSALWSVTVPVAPGRHGYAFMVDDTLFVLDPHAPTLKDRDLGTTASVVIVGRP